MKNNNRLYNLLAAGSLTALLALTFLFFRGNSVDTAAAAANTWTGTTPAIVSSSAVAPAQSNATQDPALTTLQAQNAKLTQMLQVMQEREKQYQNQLNAAGQALQATQAQAAPGDEGYEGGEHEAREHEGGEHGEGGWLGERGDDD